MSKKKIGMTNLRIGDTFGKLRVIERLDNQTKPNGWIVDRYLVMCSCGCAFPAKGASLTSRFIDRCKYCSGEWER